MNTAETILKYAECRSRFFLSELSEYLRDKETISDAGILWHIKRLIKDNKLSRIARGQYGVSAKKEFIPTLTDNVRTIFDIVHNEFPLIDICVYSGSDISAFQYHISSNKATYIEVTKDATEAVFHWLADQGLKAYHRPSEELMTEYVNLSDECVIVKPLVTESPLIKVKGVPMPTLEKTLVDINVDSDFFYLQDGETYYIMKQAQRLYNINQSKMLRYASRRGMRQNMIDLLNYKEP